MALSRVIRLMCREVTPPLAVIVPEVMVGVLPVNPDRQLLNVSYALFLSVQTHIRCGTQKSHQSLCHQSGGFKSHGDILFETLFGPRTSTNNNGLLIKAP